MAPVEFRRPTRGTVAPAVKRLNRPAPTLKMVLPDRRPRMHWSSETRPVKLSRLRARKARYLSYAQPYKAEREDRLPGRLAARPPALRMRLLARYGRWVKGAGWGRRRPQFRHYFLMSPTLPEGLRAALAKLLACRARSKVQFEKYTLARASGSPE